jgi:hypothetical protein
MGSVVHGGENLVMRYKLLLSHTPEKQFLVTATLSGQRSGSPFTACYSSDESFLRLVDRANLAPDDYARLVYATMVAATDMSKEASCEEAELDLQQLAILHLNEGRRSVA